MEPRLIPPRRMHVVRQQKDAGGRIAAIFPIHYPRALLRAFGYLPVEVWGPPGVDPSHGAAHLQPYVCSIVRNGLSFLLTGGLDVADVILVPHACDSLQGLGSLLIDFIQPRQAVIPLYLPRRSDAIALTYLAEQLQEVYERLASLTGLRPSSGQLHDCIEREETADRLLSALHHRRPLLPMRDLDFYRLVRSREYLPAESFAAVAEQTLASATADRFTGIPIVLSGIVPEPWDLFAAVESLGGVIVGDDMACCGRRRYPPGGDPDPFVRMAQSLLAAPPDSTRGSPIEARLDSLLHLARESGARGVIFYLVKFCEPELFDLPQVRRGLQQAGYPSVVVEIDVGEPLSQQAVTRMEAFFEMLA